MKKYLQLVAAVGFLIPLAVGAQAGTFKSEKCENNSNRGWAFSDMVGHPELRKCRVMFPGGGFFRYNGADGTSQAWFHLPVDKAIEECKRSACYAEVSGTANPAYAAMMTSGVAPSYAPATTPSSIVTPVLNSSQSATRSAVQNIMSNFRAPSSLGGVRAPSSSATPSAADYMRAMTAGSGHSVSIGLGQKIGENGDLITSENNGNKCSIDGTRSVDFTVSVKGTQGNSSMTLFINEEKKGSGGRTGGSVPYNYLAGFSVSIPPSSPGQYPWGNGIRPSGMPNIRITEKGSLNTQVMDGKSLPLCPLTCESVARQVRDAAGTGNLSSSQLMVFEDMCREASAAVSNGISVSSQKFACQWSDFGMSENTGGGKTCKRVRL